MKIPGILSLSWEAQGEGRGKNLRALPALIIFKHYFLIYYIYQKQNSDVGKLNYHMKWVSLQMLHSFGMGKKIKAKIMGGSQKLWNYSPLDVMYFIYVKFYFLTMFMRILFVNFNGC